MVRSILLSLSFLGARPMTVGALTRHSQGDCLSALQLGFLLGREGESCVKTPTDGGKHVEGG